MVKADIVTPGIKEIIALERWSEPRPVQKSVWTWFADPTTDGRDLIVSAPTAVGKTEAVFFPLIDRLAHAPGSQGYEILYICPLKALIDQQSHRLAPWAETKACGAFGLHGGTKRGTAESARKTGGILVTTPESLEGVLHRNQAQTLLGPLRWVVIDELHAFCKRRFKNPQKWRS
ncbi:MAG: DEAD/DEAH box helicase, partial [Pseudomonadota bacterium]